MKKYEVTAAVIRRGNRILLCGRRAGAELSEYFEFPGGKCEPGETLAACLRREIREELGTEVLVLDELGENTVELADRVYHLHFLRAMIAPGAPEPMPREGQSMFWAETAELDSVRILPGDIAIAHRLALSEKLKIF